MMADSETSDLMTAAAAVVAEIAAVTENLAKQKDCWILFLEVSTLQCYWPQRDWQTR